MAETAAYLPVARRPFETKGIYSCLAGAVAVSVVLLATAPFLSLGPLASHMAHHIVLMNIAAPLIAILFVQYKAMPKAAADGAGSLLASGTLLQLLFLWGWHLPAAHAWTAGSIPAYGLMLGTLFLAALFFWAGILLAARRAQWQSILALLVTGKLACLLGALLIFSPRLLYGGHEMHPLQHTGSTSLEDQQLAGLLMIAACPASYVLTGVLMTLEMVNRFANDGRRNPVATH